MVPTQLMTTLHAFPQNLVGVTIAPVTADAGCHSIHTYFNTSPESPDGRHVLFYASPTPEGHTGELRIIERATGRERVIARNVTTEDAHRAACQQWAGGGRTVVYHDVRDGRWMVLAVEITSGAERVLAEDRQLGLGTAAGPWIPVYGCHWNPGPHRDLELVHVGTGEIRTALTAAQVVAEYPEWVRREFGTEAVSIFFPVLSPDGRRVMIKIARGRGGREFRTMSASHRQGRIVYDLDGARFIRRYDTWGHPSWHPDSRRILSVVPDPQTRENHLVLLDPPTGEETRMTPSSPADHPSFSPDGRLFVTDGNIGWRPYGRPGENAIFLASTGGRAFAIVDRFINTGGATSWRRPDPHPVFSPDGRRIYYNVSTGPQTRLQVAELPPS